MLEREKGKGTVAAAQQPGSCSLFPSVVKFPLGNFEKPCFHKQRHFKNPCLTGFPEVMFAAKLSFSRSPLPEPENQKFSAVVISWIWVQ